MSCPERMTASRACKTMHVGWRRFKRAVEEGLLVPVEVDAHGLDLFESEEVADWLETSTPGRSGVDPWRAPTWSDASF